MTSFKFNVTENTHMLKIKLKHSIKFFDMKKTIMK